MQASTAGPRLDRRDVLMAGLGLGLGLGIGLPSARAQEAGGIVAWGDSLTAGALASAERYRYPAVAGALFDPPRSVANFGVGGQTSTQIAARQGGVPILCTVSGNSIPAAVDRSWAFENGAGGFQPRGEEPRPLVSTEGDQLVVTGRGGNFCRANVDLPSDLPAGTSVQISLDLVQEGRAEIGIVDARFPGAGVWSGPSHILPRSGRFERTIVLTATGRAFCFYIGNDTGTNRISKLSLRAVPPVAVTSKSVNVLFNSGTYRGTLAGTLAGVQGTMSTDASGAWTFARRTAGAAVPCPPGTPFIPDEVAAYRARTAWLWAGRNNFSETARVTSDIAAMIDSLPHSRFLVGAVLNAANEPAGSPAHAAIVQLNDYLAAAYGPRYVDLRGALIGAAGGGADAEDVANDVVPRSLRSDGIHLNDAGYVVIAREMHAATLARGW